MTITNNIDHELTEAELDHVVGGDMDIELHHEAIHADGTPFSHSLARCAMANLCRGPAR